MGITGGAPNSDDYFVIDLAYFQPIGAAFPNSAGSVEHNQQGSHIEIRWCKKPPAPSA